MASLVTFATASPVPSSRQVYAFCVDDGGVDVEADGVRFFPPFRHARHFDLLLEFAEVDSVSEYVMSRMGLAGVFVLGFAFRVASRVRVRLVDEKHHDCP